MITVVGSINLDLIGGLSRLPSPGETVTCERFHTAPGGKGANQALAAARAGAPVRLIGAVGQDSFATDALACLKDVADLSRVRTTHSVTGTAMILVQEDGENTIAVVPGANANVLPGDLARLDVAAAEVVLVQLEIPLATVEAALDLARAAEAVSVFNAAPYRAEAATFMAKADYLVVNETEFDLYATTLKLEGNDRAGRMANYVARSKRSVIVTLGKDGLLYAGVEGAYAVAAPAITPVDTVGAGDTFCGYLAAALFAAMPLPDALRRAAIAGSLACLKAGAQPAIPLAKDVDAALAG